MVLFGAHVWWPVVRAATPWARLRSYIRSKGSEHFLGAELKLMTEGGEELKGELYCVPWVLWVRPAVGEKQTSGQLRPGQLVAVGLARWFSSCPNTQWDPAITNQCPQWDASDASVWNSTQMSCVKNSHLLSQSHV